MQNCDYEHIMESAGLRPSPVRVMVIKALDLAEGPISSADIERVLETVDRSSIGRALTAMAECGIVHTVDDGSGSMKFELCHCCGHCNVNHHNDLHPHFRCRICGKTFCFDLIDIPVIKLPDGFVGESINYVIKGTCPKCNRQKTQ
ncbi:MAG: transcriptional repressor [Muribaculaceae bacterium]|nr:transcriptional repressor [Muribaculaceae bacterium]